jgi:hypothetical protein
MYAHQEKCNADFLYHEKGMLNAEGIRMNNDVLHAEYQWLETILENRFTKSAQNEYSINSDWRFESLAPPDLTDALGPYAALVKHHQLQAAERLLLLLALAPHHRPHALAQLAEIRSNGLALLTNRINGQLIKNTQLFLPDLSTWLFLVACDDANLEAEIYQNAYRYGALFKQQVIYLREQRNEENLYINRFLLLDLSSEYIDFLICGREPRPDYGRDFPATLLTTNMTWDNLILPKNTMREVKEVLKWAELGPQILDRAQGSLRGSYPILFYGPPGTGKSFTAALIGKKCNKHVFRVDLSQMVSKWVGETEKNLARLFDRAQGKNWILFFDEADALFSQRTGISDAKDKWANLEMSYLLQRIEEFDGLCILATNLKDNIDGAMRRRFRIATCFPRPLRDERALLWKLAEPKGYQYPEGLNFEKISGFDLTGANIANIVFNCCVSAEARGETRISPDEILYFMDLEFAKENRTANYPVK